MRCCQIQHNFKYIEYLCKLDQEYLIPLTSKCYTSGQNLLTFDISHALLQLTVAKLSTLETVRFLAHPVDSKL